MRGFILVISRNSNLRRFCVDNLVIRGYVAVGVASIENECQVLLHNEEPQLILMCGELVQLEPELTTLHNQYKLEAIPVGIITVQKPEREWVNHWNIAGYIAYRIDTQRLMAMVHAWL
ncbi:MAG: hypothetical protein ABI947_05670 [Chloroflexota bacterium]